MKKPLIVMYILKSLAFLLFGLAALVGLIVGIVTELGTMLSHQLRIFDRREAAEEPVTAQPRPITVPN
ncbi:MAG: hypothetical protein WBG71_13735 [Leeuwenhoekiella sp.]